MKIPREALKNVGGEALARRIWGRGAQVNINNNRASKIIFHSIAKTQAWACRIQQWLSIPTLSLKQNFFGGFICTCLQSTSYPSSLIRLEKTRTVSFSDKLSDSLNLIAQLSPKIHSTPFIALCLVIILGGISGCHRQTTTDAPAIKFSACSPPKGHNPIPESGCASINLPENPEHPAGPSINIHFLRIKAVNARPQADPLVLIQGGPGGSSQMMAYSLHRYFASVRQNRDLLFVDLRGTGESNPLNCPGLDSITSSMSDKEALQTYQRLMLACAQNHGQRAPFYSTERAAADLDILRSRLGYKQFNFWGASYGTRVALKYAVNYPAFTRSLVLDGLAPKVIALPRHIARDATIAFGRLNQFCQADQLCQQHYGDLAVHAETITRHLHAAEAAQQPVQIIQPDPLNQQPKEWLFTPRRFAQLLISALYSRELTSLAPRALKEAAGGNYQLLGTLSALAEANHTQLSIAEGLYYSIICNEDLTMPQPNPASDPVFMGVNIVEDKLAVCASWPQSANLPPDSHPNINHTPTLLLSGALDPVTPKPWANLVALTQLNHQIIEVPGGNHVVSTLGCIPNLIAQFINNPASQLPTDCSQAILPLPFYLGADTTTQDAPQAKNEGKHD